jgi:hypothetical protein
MKKAISLSFVEFEAAIRGDFKNTLRVIRMARFLCSTVEDLRQRQPALANKIARTLPDWPALVGRHQAARERVLPILQELQLAEDHPAKSILACDGKGHRVNLNHNLNSVALDIWEWMQRYRRPTFSDEPDSAQFRALPDFSNAAFAEWWALGWSYYLESLGGDPFCDRRLKAVAEKRNKDGRKRLESLAIREGVNVESRIATEVRKAAKGLWPRMAGSLTK